MKKKIILMVIFVLFLSSCSWFGKDEVAEENTPAVDDVTSDEFIQEQNALTQSAIDSGDLSQCDEIADENFKLDCRVALVSDQAVAANDSALCQQLEDPGAIAICENNVAINAEVAPTN